MLSFLLERFNKQAITSNKRQPGKTKMQSYPPYLRGLLFSDDT